MSSSHISLFLVLSCALVLFVSAKPSDSKGRSIEVPVASVPNGKIQETVNEPNKFSAKKEITSASVPNAKIPQTANEPNKLSAKKEITPVSVPSHNADLKIKEDVKQGVNTNFLNVLNDVSKSVNVPVKPGNGAAGTAIPSRKARSPQRGGYHGGGHRGDYGGHREDHGGHRGGHYG